VKSQIRLIRTVKHKSTRGPAYPSKERRGSKPHADKSSICRVSNQHRTLASLTRKGSRALGLGDEIFAGRCTIVSLPTYIGIVECVAPTSPHYLAGSRYPHHQGLVLILEPPFASKSCLTFKVFQHIRDFGNTDEHLR
jgi:hypothetical protein